MANAIRPRRYSAYGLVGPTRSLFPDPVITSVDPGDNDLGYEVGQVWINDVEHSAFMLTGFTSGVPEWLSVSASTDGTFNDLTVSVGPTTLEYLDSGVLVTDSNGVISASRGQDGEVLIGSTGAAPSWKPLTAGSGISITNGSGSITIASGGGTGLAWSSNAGATLTAASNNGYSMSNLNPVVTLPATPSLGDVVAVIMANTGAGATITLKAGSGDVIYWQGQALPTSGGLVSTSLTAGTGLADQLECYIEVVAISAARWNIRSLNGNFIAAT